MSTKINIPLFIFALMIQCLFIGMMNIPGIPGSVSSSFGNATNPTVPMSGVNSSSINFGMSAISMDNDPCTESWCVCDASSFYLGCVGWVLSMIWNFLLMLFSILVMVISLAVYLGAVLFNIVGIFIDSLIGSLTLFSSFPLFISIPLGLFILACNLIVIIDITLVAKGLIENII